MSPLRLSAVMVLGLVLMVLALPPGALARDEVDLGVITVKDKALAQKIRQRLLKGESFESLAKAYSLGPTASRGGRLGRVPLKRLRSEFRQALKDLPPNRPSPIVPTEGGYNILMRFGAAKAKTASPAPPADPEQRFLEARQQAMAGVEALVAGKLKEAEADFSESIGLNPHESSTPFLLEMTRQALAGKVSAKAVTTFAEGFLAMTQGQGKRAAELFAQASKSDPGLWQAKLFEANLLAGLGQKDKAKAMWRQVLAKRPDTALAYVSLAMVARDEGKLAEARRLFRKALAVNPDQAEAHYGLGGLALYEGDLPEAERQYRATLAVDPFNEEAHSDLGLALFYQGKLKEAEQQYLKALDINPSYAAAHLNLGTLYAQKKRYNQAIDEFNKALALDPTLADAHSNLAAAYILKEDWPRAIEHADAALKMNYPVPEVILKKLEPHRPKAKQ